MAHKPETVSAVRNSYVFERMSLPLAAVKFDVSIGTARRWKNSAKKAGDCWDAARASTSMTATNYDDVMSGMVNDFVTLHKSLVDDITESTEADAESKVNALNSLADSFSKFMASAGKASPKLNRLSFAVEIIQTMGSFITEYYPEHASAFAEILEPFGKELSRRYG